MSKMFSRWVSRIPEKVGGFSFKNVVFFLTKKQIMQAVYHSLVAV